MSPEGQMLIGREALAALRDSGWPVDSVGGLTLGADPISYAIAHASALEAEAGTGGMVRSFTVRKEAKQHGTGKLIEGPFQPGDKVVVVEDVITTGGSALKAVEAIRAAGGQALAEFTELGVGAGVVGAHAGTLDGEHDKLRMRRDLLLKQAGQGLGLVLFHLTRPASAG